MLPLLCASAQAVFKETWEEVELKMDLMAQVSLAALTYLGQVETVPFWATG